MEIKEKTKEQISRELADIRLFLMESGYSALSALYPDLPDLAYRTELEEKTHFLQKIIDTIPSPIFYKDIRGRYIGCNKAFEQAVGLQKERIIGRTMRDIMPEDFAEKNEALDKDLFRNPGVQAYEMSLTYADGGLRHIIANKATYTRADGSLAGLVGVISDITSQKLMQEEIRLSEERYRTLFEESSDGFFLTSVEGRILDISPAGHRLLGFETKEEITEVNFYNLYHNPPDKERFSEEIAARGFIKDFEAEILRKDGSRIILSINAKAVSGGLGNITGYRGVFKDITKHKILEDQLFQAQKMEAIGKLTGGIAHDFNNMIMAIVGYATLIHSKVAEDDPARRNIEQLMGVTERASNLTKRLLAFGRKQVISLKPVSINEIVNRVEHLLSRLIGEHIEFTTSLDKQSLTVMADSGQIDQILINLATNARDAMPRGGTLTVSTSSEYIDEEFVRAHGYGAPGIYACLSVRDTGTGMNAETQKKIFDPFFTTKEVGKGTGLGLSIVYGIVKQHNGFISVKSGHGEGTEFRMLLPTVKSKAKSLESQLSMMPFTVEGKETVLLTEDDSGVREITRAVLESAGYRVIEAVDGQDAIEKFCKSSERIKFLLLDVIMPKKNGREVYDEITGISPDVKALFFSGYTEDILNRNGMVDDELNFISKPVPPNELLKKIRDILDK